MGVSRFTDLIMWQDARKWARDIYPLTQARPFARDRKLVSQINDSAASVMANIAEGFGRGTQGEFVQFLGYAIGSINETQSHLTAAYDRKHIDRETFGTLFAAGTEVRKKAVKFMTAMVLGGSGVKNTKPAEVAWPVRVWEAYTRITGKEPPDHIKAILPRRTARPSVPDAPPPPLKG